MFRALAESMGFTEECFRDSVDHMIDTALASGNPWLAGIDRPRLEAEGHIRLNLEGQYPGVGSPARPFLPFATGNFGTPSGKAELYSASLAAQGLDPVLPFRPPVESRHGRDARAFPLELLARKASNFLNTTFSNLPSLQAMEEPGVLEMNPADAGRRGIADGDTV